MSLKQPLLVSLFFLTACTSDGDSQAFSLPQGDVDAGKLAFVDLQCNACHRVADIEPISSDADNAISIRLGGEVRHVKTYTELVTAIINPSHEIYQGFSSKHQTADGESAMRNYNDVMTVTQLVDLVSFLQTQYHLPPFERSQYRAYYPGDDVL
jgi:mono/diheme cytochrome c family protein